MIGGFIMDKREIKRKLKSEMRLKKMSLAAVSKKMNIKVFGLIYILYIPFASIKLTKFMGICKALGVSMSDIL
jgi:DNA-binding Xre family transcriptional regulator